MDEIRCKIEVREDESRLSPGRIVGTLITYGERASDRPELVRGWQSHLAGVGSDTKSASTRTEVLRL